MTDQQLTAIVDRCLTAMQQQLDQQATQLTQRLSTHIDQQIQQRMAAMNIASPPPAPPKFPTQVSANAINSLLAHPALPASDRPFARLLQLAFASQSIAEADVETCQECYDQLVDRLTDDSSVTSSRVGSRSSSHHHRFPRKSWGKVVKQGGKEYYISRKGRHHDLSRAPLYACWHCDGNHWAFQCPKKKHHDSSSSSSGSSSSSRSPSCHRHSRHEHRQNSRRGADSDTASR